MALPTVDSFISGQPSAYWAIRTAAGAASFQPVLTDGLTFVKTLQTGLRGIGTQRSYDGTLVQGTRVAVDGKWGPMTSRALWVALFMNGAPDVLKQGLAYDARRHQVGASSIIAAIWWLFHSARDARVMVAPAVADIRLPTTVVFPRWGEAAPVAVGSTGFAYPANAGDFPAQTAAVPPDATSADLATAPPPQPTVPPADADPALNPGAQGETSAIAPAKGTTTTVTAGLPWGAIGVAAAMVTLVTVASYLVISAPPPPRRAAPARARARARRRN